MDRDALSGRLLERFKADRENYVFEVFYALNAGWILDFVSHSKDPSTWNFDSFEMVAHIFHDMYRYVDTYSFYGGASFRRWVYVLSRNRMRKAFRELRGGLASLSTLRLEPSDQGRNDPLRRMIESEERADRLSSWFLLLNICRQGIEGSPSLEKRVLRWRELEDVPYRGVAERLDIPIRDVSNLVRRSRRRVARFIKARLD